MNPKTLQQNIVLNAKVAYKRGVAGPENGTEVNSNKQKESGKAFFGDYQPLSRSIGALAPQNTVNTV